MEALDEKEAKRLLLKTMRQVGYGGKQALARAAGIKQQNITEQLSGKRPLSPRLLAALGLERVTVTYYRVIGEPVALEKPIFNRKRRTLIPDAVIRGGLRPAFFVQRRVRRDVRCLIKP